MFDAKKLLDQGGYLDMFAGRLGLADALIDHIDATVSAANVKV